AEGYLWSWLENMTLAGVKIIPLGQMAGQRILQACIEQIPDLVRTGLSLHDEEIGLSSPAQAIASSLHETQYTRIYRS
ncbi:MAG: urease accessory protein UreF, partial [Candidatus Thiodiazotropha taylori]|nr:urease accessory protein UreF [Candidatus Thiodiazotropha taylori]